MATKKNIPSHPSPKKDAFGAPRTLGPVSDLERHLPEQWWKTLFNSLYLRTDGDVVENQENAKIDVDLLERATGIKPTDTLLDVCCGQGRHCLELASRGYRYINGVDRSRYLIRLARKRARDHHFEGIRFSEGDARTLRFPAQSKDCVFIMGNSFGYFERAEDDIVVLEGVRRILKPGGTFVLDIVDGEWMAQNFEARSWEWIDQQHFVNRERTLSEDKKRIITREVVTNSEMGVLADQFYAERIYKFEEISSLLEKVGFRDVVLHDKIKSLSTREQDLGMMAHRMFLSAQAPEKSTSKPKKHEKISIAVAMGDPRLPDSVKRNGVFNEEDMSTIAKLKDALGLLTDFNFEYLDNHKTLIRQLVHETPKFVLNLCDEGYMNKAELELHVPALMDMLDIPYSGAQPGCLALCYDKSKVRSIAASLEIPVPLEAYVDPLDQSANIPSTFPALLKPCMGDSSIGITQHAVVNDASQIVNYIRFLQTSVADVPILVQEFLTGNEYSVGLIGNPGSFEPLPILEVDYSKLPPHLPKILSYESKWHPDSAYWKEITYRKAEISEEMKANLINYSCLLFDRLECRDYARFDFRCDSEGVPKLLEVNPNPGWCWDGKLNIMAGFADMKYHELLEMIIRTGLSRVELEAS